MMIGFLIVLGIVLFVLYVSMMTTMIILERDKSKNIIIWSIIFLVFQVIGYLTYLIIRHIIFKKRNSFIIKLKEDEIYDKLISKNLRKTNVAINNEVFEFNNLAFNTGTCVNNNYEFICDYSSLKTNLVEDIKRAKNYILIELAKINYKEFQDIKKALIEKAKTDVVVKLIHDRAINNKLKKEMLRAGVKVYRFSKFNAAGNIYSNFRNVISIDGEVAYIGNLYVSNSQIKENNIISSLVLKIKGDIVQDVNVQTHKDVIFASGKYIKYKSHTSTVNTNNTAMQLINNNIKTDMELALIKAICMAKKSIQLELSSFIPTESIMSLLRFAINSNIDVKLMLPFKNDKQSKYYASRAYAKQLALYGANVYLYDGYIKFNAITIDDEYVIFGSFILDREHLNSSPQNMMFIKDSKAIKKLNDIFNAGIENSYRISNAKFMLIREKFFKNFV